MKKRKLIAAALCAMLAALLLPAAALAEGGVTIVSNASEFAAAVAAGGNIELSASFEIAEKMDLTVTTDVTLNLKGFTITKSYGEINHYFLWIQEGGSLTINDSVGGGVIEATHSSYGYGIKIGGQSNYSGDSGTLILNSGAIRTTQEAICCQYRAGGLIEINGGTVECVGNDSALSLGSAGDMDVRIKGGAITSESKNAIFASGSYGADGERNIFNIEISGGTLTGGNWTIYADDGVDVTVSGDAAIETTGSNGAISMSGTETFPSTLTIEGGTLQGDYVAVDIEGKVAMEMTGGSITTERSEALEVSDGASAAISGGSLVSSSSDKTAVSAEMGYGSGATMGTITITGGEFSSDVTSFADESASLAEVTTSGSELYYVGTPESLAQAVGEAAQQAGVSSITVTRGDVALTGVPSGIIVENKGSGNVSVNDVTVSQGSQVTSHKHEWGTPTWTWETDNSSAKATFTCTDNTTHTSGAYTTEVQATVTSTTTATCTQDGRTTYTATVTLDGQTYTNIKEVDTAKTGHALNHVAAKEPTYSSAGNTEYWHCPQCGKYFGDAAATREISAAATVRPKLEWDGSGASGIVTPGNSAPVTPPDAVTPPQTGGATRIALPLAALLAACAALACAIRAKRGKQRAE